MKQFLLVAALMFGFAGARLAFAQSNGNGNPTPGYPHDTIIIHVMKADTAERQCDGGHSLFLRHIDGVVPTTFIYITMIDWVQLDNDGDGLKDEDPTKDGIDQDGDGQDGEDPVEPGAVTAAIDCDSKGDSKVSLQIRDTNPERNWVSTQQWFMRMIGKPEQNFAFTSYANQTYTCTVLPGEDGLLDTEDDIAQCTTGTTNNVDDWINLASFNLASEADGECVKQVKLTGGGVKAGGKTPFCNVTKGFLVDVDTTGDDIPEETDAFIFGVRVGCVDDPATESVDESEACPLSGIVWGTDEDTTSQAKVQIFVGHTGAANVKTGKIVGGGGQ
ncbi:MAG: hypothetical protein HY706_21700 [Candidatus Hydrogenedentes bacterium]|nr:hypothetical protein [Candidatus Hydrogenedentota bacterium]